MTNQEINTHLDLCDQMIALYKDIQTGVMVPRNAHDGSLYYRGCVLCTYRGDRKCEECCLWFIVDKQYCKNYPEKIPYYYEAQEYLLDRIPAALERFYRWKQQLNAMKS